MKFNEIKTRSDLANLLKIPKKKLTHVLYIRGTDNLYTSFEIPKKSGGTRNIHAPTDELSSIQKKISQLLWEYYQVIVKENNLNTNISHAFQKNKSIFTNAKNHRNKSYVLNVDLDSFFDSFHFGRVRGYFEKNKYFSLPNEVATTLAQLTCYKGNLPQGAPSSPIITNLICNNLDIKLLAIAKKFKLNYTRYADDLTFSTNDKHFLDKYSDFLKELNTIIKSSGFKLNDKKTRLQYRDSKQEVTGLTVNKIVNIDRNYYKNTRSMAHNLYTKGEFNIDGKIGTINQLEGRFSFINQIDEYNNKINNYKNTGFAYLNSKEKQYQKFLFFKYFHSNPKPLIITEGKTDVDYIKSALKKLYLDYPNLITKKSNGSFEYKISFLNRTKRLHYFLNIQQEGADTMKNIYNYYAKKGDSRYPYFSDYFLSKGLNPTNPVILIFDNELLNKDKPLKKFTDHISLNSTAKSEFQKRLTHNINSNLYLLTHQLINSSISECEIEDLFDQKTLSTKISNKSFNRNKDNFNSTFHYSKAIFADYITKNYSSIDFNNFKPLLDNINHIVESYNNTPTN